MTNKDKTTGRGGKRPGAGRPATKGPRVTIKIAKNASDMLDHYSQCTGISMRDLASEILLNALSSNAHPDFIFCPNCGEPIYYQPLLPIGNNIIHCRSCSKSIRIINE